MNEIPTHLDLFSGIGGFALAAQWAGFRTIGFCEIDPYCRKVLAKNFSNPSSIRRLRCDDTEKRQQHDGRRTTLDESDTFDSLPRIHTDIFDLDGTTYRGVSLITGGFPCQPFSVAGKRGGAADDRAIWPEMFRVISEARPAWVLGENVPGIIPMELDNVLSDLERIGYATRTFVIPACAVDARHRRDRVWVVGKSMAHAERFRQPRSREHVGQLHCQTNGNRKADRTIDGSEGMCATWLPEPSVGRVAHGIPSRVDRLKGLGNAIVPQVAFEILREIRKLC